jgi:putative glutamine amidotransferase
MKNIIIGITDCAKYSHYQSWMENEPGVEIVKLSYNDNNLSAVQKCNGIILTGGHDVHPQLYNKPEYLEFCNAKNIDERRDEFEWKVIEHTQQKQMPVLGICRGLQFANIFFGGSLIPDNILFGKSDHSKIEEVNDRYHDVRVKADTMLKKIVSNETGEINSAHHQSADSIGKGLTINATSSDGIIEGLEWEAPEGKPFLLLVQWHPERMSNQESIFSKNIKQGFLNAVRSSVQ